MPEIPKTYYLIPAIGIMVVMALLIIPLQANDVYFLNSGSGSSSGVTSITPTGGLGTNATTGDILIFPKWAFLCQNTLVSPASNISCSFTAREHLIINCYCKSDNNDVGALGVSARFNGDSGNNYAYRRESNGGADATATSQSSLFIASVSNDGDYFQIDMAITNKQTERKLISMNPLPNRADVDATVAPSKVILTGKWSNTSNQITTITLINALANSEQYDTGTQITVWGYD